MKHLLARSQADPGLGGLFGVPWSSIDQGVMVDLYPINIGIKR
ncbi:hypothetical protein [Pseudomonas paralcaligenes]|nr:hypothetical protein [Pseudomonas paralcaligenes]